jgi:uracil-DNA glycosylase family 4
MTRQINARTPRIASALRPEAAFEEVGAPHAEEAVLEQADPRLAIPSLKILNQEIIECRRCPRLVAYREQVALMRKRAFRDWEYWGRPVPGFGDPKARLYIIGLAPAAHGGNRTGRLFTGDRSGDFLFRALYQAGFANQPTSVRRGDGLTLIDAYIGASLRCAPPANKPLPSELQNCRPFFERELTLLRPAAVLALGGIAMRAYLGMLRDGGFIRGFADYKFGHNEWYEFPAPLPRLFLSYHPSQQNTFTGKLTPAMLNQVLRRIKKYIASTE